jgi:type IV pilus assembly protein PilB
VGDLPYFSGTGCDACTGTGLKGRQGLYEVMEMSPKLRRLVLTGGDAAQIRDLAVDEGMLTLRMDGWLKVLRGVTTIEQIVRETSA